MSITQQSTAPCSPDCSATLLSGPRRTPTKPLATASFRSSPARIFTSVATNRRSAPLRKRSPTKSGSPRGSSQRRLWKHRSFSRARRPESRRSGSRKSARIFAAIAIPIRTGARKRDAYSPWSACSFTGWKSGDGSWITAASTWRKPLSSSSEVRLWKRARMSRNASSRRMRSSAKSWRMRLPGSAAGGRTIWRSRCLFSTQTGSRTCRPCPI